MLIELLKKHFFNSCINDMAAFHRIKWFCLIKFTLHSLKVSSNPSSPVLFAIVPWGETNRSSPSQVFFKINVLKNFANFTGKHYCWSLFFIKLQAWRRLQHRCFPVKFTKYLRTPFLQNTFGGCFWTNPGDLVVRCVVKEFFGHLPQVYLRFPISC